MSEVYPIPLTTGTNYVLVRSSGVLAPRVKFPNGARIYLMVRRDGDRAYVVPESLPHACARCVSAERLVSA